MRTADKRPVKLVYLEYSDQNGQRYRVPVKDRQVLKRLELLGTIPAAKYRK